MVSVCHLLSDILHTKNHFFLIFVVSDVAGLPRSTTSGSSLPNHWVAALSKLLQAPIIPKKCYLWILQRVVFVLMHWNVACSVVYGWARLFNKLRLGYTCMLMKFINWIATTADRNINNYCWLKGYSGDYFEQACYCCFVSPSCTTFSNCWGRGLEANVSQKSFAHFCRWLGRNRRSLPNASSIVFGLIIGKWCYTLELLNGSTLKLSFNCCNKYISQKREDSCQLY